MKMRKIVHYVHWYHILFFILGGGFIANQYRFDKINFERSDLEIMNEQFMDGDIIFQTSESNQSRAIQLATHSPYSHCGIIFKMKDSVFVLEAVQPVKFTPVDKWINRGEGKHYAVKRLYADSLLTKTVIRKMLDEGKTMVGKDYDLYFEWSDDRMYCSELVWKIYNHSLGLEIGKPEKLSDFDLTNDTVKKILTQRYGSNPPLNETVVSPKSIFESGLFKAVKYN